MTNSNYEKPVVLVNEDVAEGVYAASGSDCWSAAVVSVQDWNGSHHIFEVSAQHTAAVKHVSTASTVVLTFSDTLTDAYSESDFSCSFGGNSATITRELHANAYNSGDNVTYKVWAKAADEATTKALSCSVSSVTCTKTANVQGEFD